MSDAHRAASRGRGALVAVAGFEAGARPALLVPGTALPRAPAVAEHGLGVRVDDHGAAVAPVPVDELEPGRGADVAVADVGVGGLLDGGVLADHVELEHARRG